MATQFQYRQEIKTKAKAPDKAMSRSRRLNNAEIISHLGVWFSAPETYQSWLKKQQEIESPLITVCLLTETLERMQELREKHWGHYTPENVYIFLCKITEWCTQALASIAADRISPADCLPLTEYLTRFIAAVNALLPLKGSFTAPPHYPIDTLLEACEQLNLRLLSGSHVPTLLEALTQRNLLTAKRCASAVQQLPLHLPYHQPIRLRFLEKWLGHKNDLRVLDAELACRLLAGWGQLAANHHLSESPEPYRINQLIRGLTQQLTHLTDQPVLLHQGIKSLLELINGLLVSSHSAEDMDGLDINALSKVIEHLAKVPFSVSAADAQAGAPRDRKSTQVSFASAEKVWADTIRKLADVIQSVNAKSNKPQRIAVSALRKLMVTMVTKAAQAKTMPTTLFAMGRILREARYSLDDIAILFAPVDLPPPAKKSVSPLVYLTTYLHQNFEAMSLRDIAHTLYAWKLLSYTPDKAIVDDFINVFRDKLAATAPDDVEDEWVQQVAECLYYHNRDNTSTALPSWLEPWIARMRPELDPNSTHAQIFNQLNAYFDPILKERYSCYAEYRVGAWYADIAIIDRHTKRIYIVEVDGRHHRQHGKQRWQDAERDEVFNYLRDPQTGYAVQMLKRLPLYGEKKSPAAFAATIIRCLNEEENKQESKQLPQLPIPLQKIKAAKTKTSEKKQSLILPSVVERSVPAMPLSSVVELPVLVMAEQKIAHPAPESDASIVSIEALQHMNAAERALALIQVLQKIPDEKRLEALWPKLLAAVRVSDLTTSVSGVGEDPVSPLYYAALVTRSPATIRAFIAKTQPDKKPKSKRKRKDKSIESSSEKSLFDLEWSIVRQEVEQASVEAIAAELAKAKVPLPPESPLATEPLEAKPAESKEIAESKQAASSAEVFSVSPQDACPCLFCCLAETYGSELTPHMQALAESGISFAQYYMASRYWDRKKDQPTNAYHIYWLKRAAQQGLADAQTTLGRRYREGIGVKKDLLQAVKFYQLAADQGFAMAQSALAQCYEEGKGVTKDEQYAVRLYQLAADQGLALAQNRLGGCYLNGVGVEKNQQHAFKLLQLAADQGLSEAQYNLGLCYENALGVEKDEQRAVDLYQQAAKQGLVHAQCRLWKIYANGELGMKKDEKQAAIFCQYAAEQGVTGARSNLGVYYRFGIGVEKDLQRAFGLFKSLAEEGFATAQYNLGLCYEEGEGVEKDLSHAVELYRLAAEQGFAKAQYKLACYYSDQNENALAHRYLVLAAQQGSEEARNDLQATYPGVPVAEISPHIHKKPPRAEDKKPATIPAEVLRGLSNNSLLQPPQGQFPRERESFRSDDSWCERLPCEIL